MRAEKQVSRILQRFSALDLENDDLQQFLALVREVAADTKVK